MASLSRQLAQWIVGLRYEDLPPEVVDRAKGLTLQALASVLIGSQTPSGRAAAKLITEPVRYGKPGLQAQITYLAGMTANIDQKIGRDAIERYEVLKKDLDAIRAEVLRLLGPAPSAVTERRDAMTPRPRNE